MATKEYEFRECQDLDCRFRFPAPGGTDLAGGLHPCCPRCGALTTLVARTPLQLENQPAEPPLPDTRDAILLDNLRSTWNVGSILRTADGAGIGRVYLCGITPTPDHPRVTRTALGAEKNLQWSWHANSLDLAHSLVQGGKLLWALESLPGAEPVQAMASEISRPPVVLIVGNELAGIDPALLSLAERTFAIPMRGTKHSLNAAVALGIAAYELSRARK